MEEWINDLVQKYASATEGSDGGHNTKVTLLIAGEELDLKKLHNTLASNGFPVLDVCVEEAERTKIINEGDRVQTNKSVVASKNCLIKTPTALYTVAEAVLPMGYIGEVVTKTNKTASVKFDANIKVTASDQSGYLSSIDYYVETLDIPLDDLNVL